MALGIMLFATCPFLFLFFGKLVTDLVATYPRIILNVKKGLNTQSCIVEVDVLPNI